ncbi:hypothetical protein ACUN7V_14590 [Quadrisphaera oryzae]|uniref:hypothetical protein n=1 Tax=Quadrisphaera TaxID=317661 RepID=UPI001644ED3E|nr:hypothetical protein [Quadrisphaera sp. RL12-1S]MBC3763151.1 hypothetical protein [Quadrisphaera sp. RL12-1S]
MSQSRIPDTSLDAALRRLDAAPRAPLDDVARVRATSALERTLAVGQLPGARTAGRRDPLVPRPRRSRVRVALLAGAAAAVAVGVGATQVLGGGATAYASSWVPVPSAASPADVAAARGACAGSATSVAGDRADQLQPRLAERRGDLVVVALDDGTATPVTLTCVVALPPGGRAAFVAAGGGGGGARPASDALGPPGIFQQTTPGDELSIVDGLVGDRVRAVTVRTAEGRVVEATVQDGHYAAWWPGLAMRRTTEPFPEGSGGGCAGDCDGTRLVEDFTLDVTLADGTVVRGLSASGV